MANLRLQVVVPLLCNITCELRAQRQLAERRNLGNMQTYGEKYHHFLMILYEKPHRKRFSDSLFSTVLKLHEGFESGWAAEGGAGLPRTLDDNMLKGLTLL